MRGYTEWTAVKRGRPLYKGNRQPRVPYENDYYDLSDSSVMRRQMKTAKKYGIDGFCCWGSVAGGQALETVVLTYDKGFRNDMKPSPSQSIPFIFEADRAIGAIRVICFRRYFLKDVI